MINDELKLMLAKEEKLLDESHRRTVERHEEIMAAIEKAALKRKKPTVIGVTMSSS